MLRQRDYKMYEFMKVIVLKRLNCNQFAAILTNPPIRAGKETLFTKFYEEAYEKLG